MHLWLSALHAALRAEERAQRVRHEEWLALPLAERVDAGVTWHPVRLEVDGAEVVVRPQRGGSLSDEIGAGDQVTLDPPGRPGSGPRARVLGVDPDFAVLRMARGATSPDEAAVSLDFDASTFVRQRQALERADRAPGPLRDLLLAARLPDAPVAPPASVLAALDGLEAAQREAAIAALSATRLAAIHGPPGTGKTHTLTALLRALVTGGDRPWALADSNAAVDHLAVQAARAGLDVVRLGPLHRLSSAAAPLAIDRRLRRGPHADAIAAVERELSRARAARAPEWALREIARRRDALLERARHDAIASAQVVATTLGTLARIGVRLPPAHTAVVDEASQAIEPAVWAAVPHVERLVLVGDPHQLGPVVVGAPEPLGHSLLDRMLREGRIPLPMLREQRRMSHPIAALVRRVYGPDYRPHPSVAEHRLRDLPGVTETEWTTAPLRVIDTASAGEGEVRDPVTGSLHNPLEARVVAHVVTAWRAAGVPAEAIGVATPYRAQRARLRALPELSGVTVDTINAFQGREREAMVLSMVRANDAGALGFVADDRRLTVAITRARRALVVIGELATLASHPRLDQLARDAETQGALRSVWELDGLLSLE